MKQTQPENMRTKKEATTGLQVRAFTSTENARVTMTVEECMTLCKSVGVEYRPGYESRVIQYRYTDATVDRYGDKVIPSGVKLDNYMGNPIVLGFHDSSRFPIGATLKCWYDGERDAVMGQVLFLDDQVDTTGFAETCFRMAAAGVIRTGSIGFMVKKVRNPSEDERKKLGMSQYGYIYDETELLEYSITPLPANPNSTQEAVRKGMFTQKAVDTLRTNKFLPAEEMAAFEQALKDYESVASEEVVGTTIVTTSATNFLLDEKPAPESVPGKKKSIVTLNVSGYTAEVAKSVEAMTAAGYDVTVNLVSANQPAAQEPIDIEKALASFMEQKAGAVLSKKNKASIENIQAYLEQALEEANSLLGGSADEPQEEDKGIKDATSEEVPAGSSEGGGLYDPATLGKYLDNATERMKGIRK